ncbi:MAG TPA: hypothetical protein VFJ58_14560 [Armatimonadota bacterium]|nr:hypothetical protein [Armatimonadota bacterium]
MSDEQGPLDPMTDEIHDACEGAMALKAVVVVLAVAVIAAPVAYGAYEINDLNTPGIDIWRWPAIFVLAAAFVVLAWYAVVAIRKAFPYS